MWSSYLFCRFVEKLSLSVGDYRSFALYFERGICWIIEISCYRGREGRVVGKDALGECRGGGWNFVGVI